MQSNSQQKASKLKPVIRAREIQVDQEMARLAELRGKKTELVVLLRKYQQDYVNGVDQLNTERSSMDRSKLNALESAVDYSKVIWYQTLRKVQEFETREREQLKQVLNAEMNLKSVERLLIKHVEAIKMLDRRSEQGDMDEIAARRVVKG